DDDGSGEGSSEQASQEDTASEELPESSASALGSESEGGDCSEAADEDDSEDDASSAAESLSSSEKPAKKQKTEKPEKDRKNEKPDKSEKKTEKPDNREKKTEKPDNREKKTEKPDSAKKTEKPDSAKKTEKPERSDDLSSRRKEKKEKKEKEALAVQKLTPTAAAAIGKAMVCAGETTEQGAADLASANSSLVIKLSVCGLKKREIEKKYPAEKAKALIDRLLKKKMYEEDEDFPGDEEEYFFYVSGGAKMRRESKTTESLGLKVKDNAPDKGLVDALTGEGGLLASGALPTMEGMNEEGSKNLLNAMVKDGVAKPKPAKTRTEEDVEKLAPKEPWELCQDRMNEILNESASSRKYALSLAHIDYSGDLSSDLQKHSSKLESIYTKLQGLKKANVQKNSKYTKFYEIIDAMHAWYEKAEAQYFVSGWVWVWVVFWVRK
ncbi:unnamed protein product, partial [Symbiodinium necroappetens]